MGTRVTEISRTYREDPRTHDAIVASLEGQGWFVDGMYRPDPARDGVTLLSHPDVPGHYREVEYTQPEQSIDDALGLGR